MPVQLPKGYRIDTTHGEGSAPPAPAEHASALAWWPWVAAVVVVLMVAVIAWRRLSRRE